MKDLNVYLLDEWLSLSKGNLLLLDVREKWEFEICSIKDSCNIPLGILHESISSFDKVMKIICICHHGIRSKQACYILNMNGFSNVFNLEGGIDQWAKVIQKSMNRY